MNEDANTINPPDRDAASDDRQAISTLETIERFHNTVNRHDVDAIMAAMTEDCLFDNTFPPPDGERHEGQAAVRAFWEGFFRLSPHAAFDVEELFGCGNRAVLRWVYRWRRPNGEPGHVRGVDVFRVRGGKVAEKLSYVKG